MSDGLTINRRFCLGHIAAPSNRNDDLASSATRHVAALQVGPDSNDA